MLKSTRLLAPLRVVSARMIPARAFSASGASHHHCSSTSSAPEAHSKKLFTPGPLGVSYETKAAMLRDLGSRDTEFINIVKFIRSSLLSIADVSPAEFAAVPFQGSGTSSVEAVLGSVVPRENGKVFIVVNGAYGRRMTQIADILQYDKVVLDGAENEKADIGAIRKVLSDHPDITTVCIVHCETSSGVIHPIEEVGQAVAELVPNATFFVDAMSSFGAIPIDFKKANIDFLVSSANKCIEGVPGFSYAIGKLEKLMKCKGWARSFSLDLFEQYVGLEKTGQFRTTPPTHALLAFKKALEEMEEEGGVAGRSARYQQNRAILRKGMKAMGFKELLDDSHEGYIITSFHFPKHPNFDFTQFYSRLSEKDQVIYPGKVTKADCFRIGNIGHLFPEDMEHLLSCIKEVCSDMSMTLPLES